MPAESSITRSREQVIREYLEASNRLAMKAATHPIAYGFVDSSGCLNSCDKRFPNSPLEPERTHYLSLW